MCGFYFSTSGRFTLNLHTRLSARGPDNFNKLSLNNCIFAHSHLSVFSAQHDQPFYDEGNELVLLFNGEIYNCPNSMTEAEFIIEQYKTHGGNGFEKLDGEFAICLVDFLAREILIATDPFATKPCFYSSHEGFHVSSYPSSLLKEGVPKLSIRHARPNTLFRVNFDSRQLLERKELVQWDLNQTNSDFDAWITNFDKAVLKRSTHMCEGQSPFVGISSGYDSGAIHASLLKSKTPFLGISIMGKEDFSLVELRQKLSRNKNIPHILLDAHECKKISELITNSMDRFVEDLPYEILSSGQLLAGEPTSVKGDKAAFGVGILACVARAHKSIICLSGSGADETISDYGFGGKKIYQHSNFGGLWPTNLQSIFPWSSFYGSTQQSYIRKEEAVGGAFGIETRYPFLDKAVVQSFLNLRADLKNSAYKAPLNAYLSEQKYPFKQEKRGFSPWAA